MPPREESSQALGRHGYDVLAFDLFGNGEQLKVARVTAFLERAL